MVTFFYRILLGLFFYTLSSFAQSIDPRLYSNAPVDTNFLALGYVFTNGTLPNYPEIKLEDAHLNVNIIVLGYAHVFELFGQSAKVDVIVPSGCIKGDALYQGRSISRNVCGLGDIKGRISYNIYGAPAVSLKEFAGYSQDVIVGTSLQITAPTGQYDSSKLANIGTNRWAIKPSIGISKAIDKIVLELSSAVEFYSDNDVFLQTIKRAQEPIYSTQVHMIYNFSAGTWLGLDANYYWGGETSKNGVKSDDRIEDSRFGATFSMPITKLDSIKIYGNGGVYTRTGTKFNMLGVVLQHRF